MTRNKSILLILDLNSHRVEKSIPVFQLVFADHTSYHLH